MKIAYVINNATYTSIPIEMASLLAENNEVFVLVLYDSQEKAEKVIRTVAPDCGIIGFDYKKKRISGLRDFKNEIQSGKYDIIHTHQTFSGSLARLLSNKRSKLVHTVHANHNSFSIKQNIAIGITLWKCDAVVFNSQTTKDGLKPWQKQIVKNVKQTVIYNGVNVERVQKATENYAVNFCQSYGIDKETFLLGQVGRLEPVKNPMGTLKAFQQIINNHPNEKMRLIFVGDGSQKNKLYDYIHNHPELESNVFLLGTVARDNVYCLMHRMDGMIVPSKHEGFCNALFEGLSAGTALAVSDIPVFDELLNEELEIIKFDPNDIFSIEKAIWELYSKKDVFLNKEINLKYALEYFDSHICVCNYERFYKQLL